MKAFIKVTVTDVRRHLFGPRQVVTVNYRGEVRDDAGNVVRPLKVEGGPIINLMVGDTLEIHIGDVTQ